MKKTDQNMDFLWKVWLCLCVFAALLSSCAPFRTVQTTVASSPRAYRLVCWQEDGNPYEAPALLFELGCRPQQLDLKENGLFQRPGALLAYNIIVSEDRVSMLERHLTESGIQVQHLAAIP